MSESETETTTEAVVETPRRKRSTSTSTSAETRTLAERMAAAMAHIHPPPKAGKMVMQGKPIPYVTVDDLMEVLRPSLAAEGIAFSISVEDVRKGLADPVGVMLRVRLASAEEALEGNAYGEGRTFPSPRPTPSSSSSAPSWSGRAARTTRLPTLPRRTTPAARLPPSRLPSRSAGSPRTAPPGRPRPPPTARITAGPPSASGAGTSWSTTTPTAPPPTRPKPSSGPGSWPSLRTTPTCCRS